MAPHDEFQSHLEQILTSFKVPALRSEIKNLASKFLSQSSTFDLFLQGRLLVLETSFGFGIFSLYALCHNTQIKYIGVDPLKETHQQRIAGYLAKEFKERFLLIKGQPSAILPALAMDECKEAIDAFFINAHQSPADCFTDIANAIRLSTPQSLILIDASKPENTLPPYQSIAKKGRLKPISFKNNKLPDHLKLATPIPDSFVQRIQRKEETQGIVLVATGEKYLDEACIAIPHIRKHHPELEICLFCDQVNLANQRPEINDHKIRLEAIENPVGSFVDKMQALVRTPYQRTLYLDCDTIITGNLEELFKALDHFDLLCAMAPGRFYFDWEKDIAPACISQHNTGVLAYRLGAQHQTFFKIWGDIHKRLESEFDQPSFRLALLESNVKYATLPSEYNFRADFPQFANLDVKVFHSHDLANDPALAKDVIQKVNSSNLPRVWSGRDKLSKVIPKAER